MSIKSADDLIVQVEAERLGKPIPEVPKTESKESESTLTGSEESNKAEHQSPQAVEGKAEQKENKAEKLPEETQSQSSSETSEEVDEYGTKLPKQKLYTEEEVQKMIRERLQRGRFAETQQSSQQQQQQIQDAAQNFTPDPNSNDSWEVQLEDFIVKTLEKQNRKQQEREWQRREEETQAQFEIKFSQGMAKYDDFGKVVGGKPITEAMMIAARSLNDPAGFIYAASKNHAAELDRISKIPDKAAQMVEVGRLEEKMRKIKNMTTAPKPVQKEGGDASTDVAPKRSIDSLIIQHAKSKIR